MPARFGQLRSIALIPTKRAQIAFEWQHLLQKPAPYPRCVDARALSPFRDAIRYSSRLEGNWNHGSAWVVMPNYALEQTRNG